MNEVVAAFDKKHCQWAKRTAEKRGCNLSSIHRSYLTDDLGFYFVDKTPL